MTSALSTGDGYRPSKSPSVVLFGRRRLFPTASQLPPNPLPTDSRLFRFGSFSSESSPVGSPHPHSPCDDPGLTVRRRRIAVSPTTRRNMNIPKVDFLLRRNPEQFQAGERPAVAPFRTGEIAEQAGPKANMSLRRGSLKELVDPRRG